MGVKVNKNNLVIIITVLSLSLFGLIMVYSSSSIWSEYKFEDSLYFFKHQGLFLCIGILGMYILSKIDYKIYYKKANLIILICFLLLGLVLIPGIGTIRNGSRSWFGIGSFGIQPSEFAKIGLIIFTAKYLANNEKIMANFKKGAVPILIIIFLFFALIMLEPDFGTGMVIVGTLVGMLFVSNIKLNFFAYAAVTGLVGIAALIIAAPYRIARIISFLNPWSDPLGSGFQIIQSLYAIGPAGLFGLGFGNSIQKHFYLPEPQTDFIFAIISEEFGFLGIIILATLYLTLFYKVLKISINSSDLFAKYLSFGLIFGIMIQTVLNISVVIGLVPVTGVTLPFFSYGGSSLLVSLASIGIILNISKEVK
ncbi:MAG: putative lipid II flippase FtsW [Bacilli bacterium]|nr:putative lipid II flippase FtsW [Bacilli bacterium]MDD4795245.1 putative lipid II flippase FtsW [Bacilli bacterium]